MIRSQTDKGSPLGPILQTFENRVIGEAIGNLRELKIHCIPCVDEIMVPWQFREAAKNAIGLAIHRICGTSPKIGDVQLTKFYPCPSEYCPKCWNENKAMRLGSPFPCSHQPQVLDPFPGIEFLEA